MENFDLSSLLIVTFITITICISITGCILSIKRDLSEFSKVEPEVIDRDKELIKKVMG